MKETVRKLKETAEIQSSVLNRIRSHRYFPIMLLVSAILAAAFIHIWQRVKVVELVKDISSLKREQTLLLDDKKKLYAEIASLSTSSRIMSYAQDSLGLQQVAADRLLTLVREEESYRAPGELERMLSAIKRVASYAPVIEQTTANAQGAENINFDSTLTGWESGD